MELSWQLRFSLDHLLDDLEHCESQARKAVAALKTLAHAPRHKKAIEALQPRRELARSRIWQSERN